MHIINFILIGSTIILLLFLAHSILPTYYNKLYNRNITKKTKGKKRIMLTFDDGPDPRYTNDLLDILKDNNVRATFFVVANNAKGNPDIINRMLEEGHEVALHSLEHKNAWLYSYFYTKKDFLESLNIMKKLGVDVKHYRPPWGHTNIFSAAFARKHNLKIILWSVMAEDWEKDATVEVIVERLKRRTRGNSIICLHDSGENSGGADGAPRRTIDALKIAIPELKASGFRFITPERS
ncbi:polysaccharide deacetylase family protein [Clostridioides mangenotii]|uniref:polysaccharide deacetylase family protein n=1 Tax=Metaclostridioides mangenotii TaxID=1540 RepID=UPI00214A7660|nr:polysaccharide deacetylase family protein [Clostridioides mangenotii]MCR1954295.1 polysaccharide deacetylase family protein [Clostridioides mangenotii]